MKLKKGFLLKEIAGENVVVSVDSKLDLDSVITLNSTAKTLWVALENGVDNVNELVNALLNEYEVDEMTAKTAAENFLAKLAELDFLD